MLVDKPVLRFVAPRLVGDRPHVDDHVTAVDAVGKNLLIHFDTNLVLLTHMKMSGAWHIYRTSERWQKGRHLMRVLIEVPGWLAVCFAAPVVRTYRADSSQPSPVAHLGPDLCAPNPQIAIAVARIGEISAPGTSIAEALLDQRISCGIGNVYKSEALWACRVSPFTAVEKIDEQTRRRLFVTASKQLRANLSGGPRTTVPGGLAVYGRRGSSCRDCGTPIEMRRHGAQPRSTYWCPLCQPDVA